MFICKIQNIVPEIRIELASELESIYNSSVGEKYKIMLLMTYIDILSKIWHFHNNNISKKQGEYFKVWMNESNR
jgi:hypothetical protein